MYDLEFYLYGLIPMIVGILIMWKSIQISFKRRMNISWLITFIIFIFVALAENMLFLVSFTEAWPTFLPHILLILNLILLGIQLLIKNMKSKII